MSGRVSVLVVNFNGGSTLETALEKWREVCPEWHELIVADNGSTDGSLDRAREQFPDAEILELGENLGFGTANNRAAERAEGDYLLLLNSDAWPLPGCVERLKSTLDQRPEVGLVCPRLVYADDRPQFHWAPVTSVLGEAIQIVRNRFESCPWVHRPWPSRGWFTAACVMVRKRAFQQIGGFDEGFFLYFEDVDLCLRLRQAGWRLVDEPAATAKHLKGGSQATAAGTSLHYRLGQARYYCKHRPRWEQQFIRRKILAKLKDRDDRRRLQEAFESRAFETHTQASPP